MSSETQQSTITPVIVLGIARNGTTWLGNLLAGHTEIAAAAHFLHHGVHESNILLNKRYWGNLETVDEYISFVHLYASEDYFKLVQGDIDYFLKHRQPDFYRFFFELMDRHAVKNSRKYWTTKLDPLFYLDDRERNEFVHALLSRYPRTRFVAIKRSLIPYLNSYLNMEGSSVRLRKKKSVRLAAIFLGVLRYINSYKKIGKIINDNKGLQITYEELLENKEHVLARIAAYVEIASDEFNETEYRPNTSFQSAQKSELNSFHRAVAKALYGILHRSTFGPSFLLRMYQRIKSTPAPLFHRLIKYEYYQNELKDELEKKGSFQLLEKLKDE
ncbi:MAG: sulfotransferase [Spirochaetaceae bacterium]|nr:sulfotransferase [Spirochaetaceae bacterium]